MVFIDLCDLVTAARVLLFHEGVSNAVYTDDADNNGKQKYQRYKTADHVCLHIGTHFSNQSHISMSACLRTDPLPMRGSKYLTEQPFFNYLKKAYLFQRPDGCS